MGDEWFYLSDNQQLGPVSSKDLKALALAGTLMPADLVWREGVADWVPASKLTGLFPQLHVAGADQKRPPAVTSTSSAAPSFESSAQRPTPPFSRDSTPTPPRTESASRSAARLFEQVKAGAADFASKAKAAAQLTAKQAERTKIARFNLPAAFVELGKNVHSTASHRQEFATLYEAIDALLRDIEAVEAHASIQPKAKGVADKAKAAAGAAKDIGQIKALQLRAWHSYSELGKAAFEKYGERCGPQQLVQPIQEALSRQALLDAEIAKLSESPPGQIISPKRLAVGGLAAAACLALFLLSSLFHVGGLGERIKGEWKGSKDGHHLTMVIESSGVRLSSDGETKEGRYVSTSNDECEFVLRDDSGKDVRFTAHLGEDDRLILSFLRLDTQAAETLVLERSIQEATARSNQSPGKRSVPTGHRASPSQQIGTEDDPPSRDELVHVVYLAAAGVAIQSKLGRGPSPEEFIELTHAAARQLGAEKYAHSQFLLTLKPDRDRTTTVNGVQGRVLGYGSETAIFMKSKLTGRVTFVSCSINGDQKMNVNTD